MEKAVLPRNKYPRLRMERDAWAELSIAQVKTIEVKRNMLTIRLKKLQISSNIINIVGRLYTTKKKI